MGAGIQAQVLMAAESALNHWAFLPQNHSPLKYWPIGDILNEITQYVDF